MSERTADTAGQGHARAKRLTPRQRAFVERLEAVGSAVQASKQLGIARSSHYRWLETNAAYAEAVARAKRRFGDEVLAELRRRGIEGVDEPVFHQGAVCGYIRRYSDKCLEILARLTMPELQRAEVVGAGGGPIQFQVVQYGRPAEAPAGGES